MSARFFSLTVAEQLLQTLWVGGLWAIGYLVAPILFHELDDRAMAGGLAGAMFRAIAWLGLAAGTLLLLSALFGHAQRSRVRIGLLMAMLASVVAGHFGLGPMIAELRSEGMADAAMFARLHGAASVLYLITSLLGLWLVLSSGRDTSA